MIVWILIARIQSKVCFNYFWLLNEYFHKVVNSTQLFTFLTLLHGEQAYTYSKFTVCNILIKAYYGSGRLSFNGYLWFHEQVKYAKHIFLNGLDDRHRIL